MTFTAVHPVSRPLSAEQLFLRLGRRPGAFFHDNAFRPPGDRAPLALGSDPALVVRWGPGSGLTTEPAVDWLPRGLHPLDALRRVLELYAVPSSDPHRALADLTNFGYLGYELGSLLEPTVPGRGEDPDFPDLYWAFYDRVLVVDPDDAGVQAVAVDCPLWQRLGITDAPHRARELAAWAQEAEGEEPSDRWSTAGGTRGGRFQEASLNPNNPKVSSAASSPVGEFDRAEYVSAVARVIEYIRAGDIFQANLSQRFTANLPLPAPELYLKLRRVNPAPHAGYLAVGACAVLSASPELFVRLDEAGVALTRPIKGTRKRSDDPAVDARLRAELWTSPKDAAELTMIIDLERNDLGRVCEFGSVKVSEPRRLESHPTVHHLVAGVSGRLRPDCDRIDLLRAAFPGGSITGAPKVRSMQIIRELERSARRVYTGSLGRFGMAGGMELNIAIRTLCASRGKVSFGVGGGIVADSDPELEYEETLHKAAGLLRALKEG